MLEALFIILSVELIRYVLLCKSGIPQPWVMSAIGIYPNPHILTPNALLSKAREIERCSLVVIADLLHPRLVKGGCR